MQFCLRVLCVALFVSAAVALPINDDRPAGDDDTAAAAAPAAQSADHHIASIPSTMSLPSNATAIRAEITDTFSCAGKIYGYYADVDNDCQIFHICLPVTYADGKENTFRWSFVCPDETIFSQELFTCIRPADWNSDCSDSGKFVALNRQFGATPAADDDAEVAAVAAPIETRRRPAVIAAAATTAAPVVPIYVRTRKPVAANEERIVVADVRPDEQNVVASVKSILQQAVEVPVASAVAAAAEDKIAEPVPVYDDAETSESQSFGLFKVIFDNSAAETTSVTDVPQELDLAPVEQSNLPVEAIEAAVVAEDEVQHQSVVDDVAEPVGDVAEPVADEETPVADVAAPVADVAAPVDEQVTEIADVAAAAVDESTELWNHLITQSLYDGGSTVDDNVEVNAIAESEALLAVTEAIGAR